MHMTKQCTSHILMVRPSNFGFNPETAESNAFQVNDQSLTVDEIKAKAVDEFDGFVRILRSKGIHVHVMEEPSFPVTPDAVFPNNWITFHETGYVITYPMQASARRLERRDDFIYTLAKQFVIHKRYYMEFFEDSNLFLEGTGSMIFDREHQVVYACLSPRTDQSLLDSFCDITGYTSCYFKATDQNEQEIYHTNVMMAMGDHFVVICMDSVKNKEERDQLKLLFEQTKKQVIDLTMDQMNAFAGNMLQLKNDQGETFLIMSEQAYRILREDQIEEILKFTQIIHAPLYTIEKYGGGSARCMMAEIFLPQK